MNKKKLARQQMSDKLEALTPFALKAKGVPSWIRYLRTGLGMSVAQLAKRMGLSEPSVYQLERLEKDDRITLLKLRQATEALNCELVYAFIPRDPLEKLVEKQAHKRATTLLGQANAEMEMEDQAISKQNLNRQHQQMLVELLYSKTLWDD